MQPEPGTCCCGHGVRCSCSLKKEHLDTVPEDLAQASNLHKDTHKRPISSLNNHESKITVFTNGHHKPVHKINDAHNHCGAPYRLPHKPHPLAAQREVAQRSSDSLPLTKSHMFDPSPLHDSITSAPQNVRKVRSEHNSPVVKAVSDRSQVQDHLVIPPLDPQAYGYSPFDNHSISQNSTPDYQFPDQIPDHLFMSYEQAHQYEPPFPSVGLGDALPEIDWSAYSFQDSDKIPDIGSPTYASSQAPSYMPNDYLGRLGQQSFTASRSELTEGDDFVKTGTLAALRNDSPEVSREVDGVGGPATPEAYRLSSASALSYPGLPATQMLGNAGVESTDIDDFLEQANQHMRVSQHMQPALSPSTFLPLAQQELPANPDSTPSLPNPVTGEHPYTVAEAQSYAHLGDEDVAQQPPLPTPLPKLADDPMWSCPQTPGGTNLNFEGDDDEWPQ